MALQFEKPIDGDVLFSFADGTPDGKSLTTSAVLRADAGKKILINGILTRENPSGIYTAEIRLDGYRNAVEAVDSNSGESQTIYIYWFENGYKTYRLGVDDVIWCFENLYKNQEHYHSIFEDPFLAVYKELHDTYQTKVHMHLFYENQDGSFNLSMFPDKYKQEFIKNADWLKFTFHSRAEFPDSPYKHASYAQTFQEGKEVEREIRRFAGSEVLSNVTSQHWADSNLYATRAFRALGYKIIDGYFLFDENGEPYVSYYLNQEQTAHAHSRDFWVDNKEDIIFVKDDIIINEVELNGIDGYMERLYHGEDHAFMYLLIHEQYFYKDYIGYQPDYKERIFRTVQWCVGHGYRSAFLSDIAFENRLCQPR